MESQEPPPDGWGPWVVTQRDGQPYLKPPGPDRYYPARLIAPLHPTLGIRSGFLHVEWDSFDLEDHVDPAKVVRQLMGIANRTSDDRALAGFLYAVADCLAWWAPAANGSEIGGWYQELGESGPIAEIRNCGWDRLTPEQYEWTETARPYPYLPEVWGPWWLDDLAMVLQTTTVIRSAFSRA